jgi:alpha-maltose-1-phosphate synthase
VRLTYLCADPGVPVGGLKGAAVHVAELVRALAECHCEILLLAAELAPGARTPPGVTLEQLPAHGRGTPLAQRLAGEDDLTSWVARRSRDFGAQALYERFALHTAAGSRAARLCDIPHLLEVNAPLREEAESYRRLEEPAAAAALEDLALRGAAIVLAVSPPLARWALAGGAARAEVLPNGVAVERFRPGPVLAGPPRAAFVGSLRPWHGVEVIAEAWELLGEDAPELLVVGDGPGRDALRAAGARMLGAVPHHQVPGLLGRAHIGLAPYTSTGPRYFSPLKVFEYLAAGLAVVTADLPGVVEPLPAEALLIIPAGDAAALAAGVGELAADTQLRERLGSRGRVAVETCHTWRHRARRVKALAAEMGASPEKRSWSGRRGATAAAVPAAGVPPDPALPSADRLLDADGMLEVLQGSLGGPGIERLRILTTRYKPHSSLTVRYEAQVGEVARTAVAIAAPTRDLPALVRGGAALAGQLNGRSPAVRPLAYEPDLDALVQWLPMDAWLPALAMAPHALTQRLQREGIQVPSLEPTVLAYRPCRRAVLRLGDHVLKVYSCEESLRAALPGFDVSAELVKAARPRAVCWDLRLVVQRWLPERPTSHEVCPEVLGQALRRVHGLPLRPWLAQHPPTAHLRKVERSMATIAAVLPHLGGRLRRIVAWLRATVTPGLPLVLSHGDFHRAQVLCGADLIVIDFDKACRAPAAMDAANYCGRAVHAPEDVDGALGLLERFLGGYGGRPPGLEWYVVATVARRLWRPLQRVSPDWPEKVELRVAATEALLAHWPARAVTA